MRQDLVAAVLWHKCSSMECLVYLTIVGQKGFSESIHVINRCRTPSARADWLFLWPLPVQSILRFPNAVVLVGIFLPIDTWSPRPAASERHLQGFLSFSARNFQLCKAPNRNTSLNSWICNKIIAEFQQRRVQRYYEYLSATCDLDWRHIRMIVRLPLPFVLSA